VRGLTIKRVKQKQKVFLSSSLSLVSARFCQPLNFPKTRKLKPKLGLAYERNISLALYKTLSEINLSAKLTATNHPGANHLLQDANHPRAANHLSATNHLLDFLTTNHLLPSTNHLSDRRIHFCFCFNPWINYQLASESFSRNASPDFVIFVFALPASYPFLDHISENFTQITSENLSGAIAGNGFSPHGNFLFKHLLSAIVLEAKLTYTEVSHKELSQLYLPLVEKSLSQVLDSGNFLNKVSGAVIVKNLTPFSPCPAVDSIFYSLRYSLPLIQWLGNGKIPL
jgi:hypothetical protein